MSNNGSANAAGARGGKPKVTKNTIKTAKRLLGYVTGTYKAQFILVLFCILPSPCHSGSCWMILSFR